MQIVKTIFIKKEKRSEYSLLFFFLIVNFFFNSNSIYANGSRSDENAELNHALELKLYDDPTWLALTHFYKNASDIEDENFYSNKHLVTSKQEFIDSYNSLIFENSNIEKCRFPARYLWLNQKLRPNFKININDCAELTEFISKAPMDKVSVIFASENISLPTSMMGHIFIKIAGKNEKNELLEHSISFFTNVTNISFPSLVYKSLISGMRGYYSLSPYNGQKNSYLYNEQRNIWEYELNLTPNQIKLMQYHLYEIKNISFKYFFHAFNCATLTSNILSVSTPIIKTERTNWVTPLDIVRSVSNLNLVSKISMTPSNVWKIRSISESIKLNKKQTELIKNNYIQENDLNDQDVKNNYLLIQTAKSYNDYLFESNQQTKEKWNTIDDHYSGIIKKDFNSSYLELTNYKLPHKTIQDSQVSIGQLHTSKDNLLKISFLPASHSLEDNTIEYSNESQLKLGEVSIAYLEKRKKVKIDSVILFSAIVFRPSNKILDGLSGSFEFGYLPKIDNELNYSHAYTVKGGLGKTYRITHDFDSFFILNLDLSYNQKFKFNPIPELGFIIREIWNMKSWFSICENISLTKNNKNQEIFKLVQSKYFANYSLNFTLQHNQNSSIQNNQFELQLKKFF